MGSAGGGGSGGDDGAVTEPDQVAPAAGAPGALGGTGLTRGWLLAGLAVVVALTPLAFLGPGTDIDVGAVLRSGISIVEDGTYRMSRAPGAPVHETAVGVLHAVGGTLGPNLGSLVAATALVLLLASLLRREGVGRVGLSVAVVVANPWFLASAVSTVDFLWALALWAGAALVLRTRRTLGGAAVAGLLGGLAVGTRASTAVLVAVLALAEALDHRRADRVRGDPTAGSGADAAPDRPIDGPGVDTAIAEHRADAPSPVVRAGIALVVAAAVGLLLFVPGFRAAESSLGFAQNDVPTSSFAVQVGRFVVKDLYFFGPFAAVVLVLCGPAVARALGRWRSDWLVRVGLLTVVASQLLFLRFPWKMGHLLPTLVGLALLLARALGDRPRLLVALVATQLLYAFVSVTLIRPDTPNAATGGRFTFEVRPGALVTDVRCRADDPDAWEAPTPDRIFAVWDCAKPWAE